MNNDQRGRWTRKEKSRKKYKNREKEMEKGERGKEDGRARKKMKQSGKTRKEEGNREIICGKEMEETDIRRGKTKRRTIHEWRERGERWTEVVMRRDKEKKARKKEEKIMNKRRRCIEERGEVNNTGMKENRWRRRGRIN